MRYEDKNALCRPSAGRDARLSRDGRILKFALQIDMMSLSSPRAYRNEGGSKTTDAPETCASFMVQKIEGWPRLRVWGVVSENGWARCAVSPKTRTRVFCLVFVCTLGDHCRGDTTAAIHQRVYDK